MKIVKETGMIEIDMIPKDTVIKDQDLLEEINMMIGNIDRGDQNQDLVTDVIEVIEFMKGDKEIKDKMIMIDIITKTDIIDHDILCQDHQMNSKIENMIVIRIKDHQSEKDKDRKNIKTLNGEVIKDIKMKIIDQINPVNGEERIRKGV